MSDHLTSEELEEAVVSLKHNEAIFVIRALLAAGHVSHGIIQRSIALAETINWKDKP